MSSAEEYIKKTERKNKIRKLERKHLEMKVLLGTYIFSLLYAIKDLSISKMFLIMMSQVAITIFTEKKKQYYKELKEFENE